MRPSFARSFVAAIMVLAGGRPATAQRGGPLPDSVRARRWAIENELQSIAVVDRKVMIAPTIMSPEFGGEVQVSGDPDELERLMILLKTPPLPGQLVEESFGAVPAGACESGSRAARGLR